MTISRSTASYRLFLLGKFISCTCTELCNLKRENDRLRLSHKLHETAARFFPFGSGRKKRLKVPHDTNTWIIKGKRSWTGKGGRDEEQSNEKQQTQKVDRIVEHRIRPPLFVREREEKVLFLCFPAPVFWFPDISVPHHHQSLSLIWDDGLYTMEHTRIFARLRAGNELRQREGRVSLGKTDWKTMSRSMNECSSLSALLRVFFLEPFSAIPRQRRFFHSKSLLLIFFSALS